MTKIELDNTYMNIAYNIWNKIQEKNPEIRFRPEWTDMLFFHCEWCNFKPLIWWTFHGT